MKGLSFTDILRRLKARAYSRTSIGLYGCIAPETLDTEATYRDDGIAFRPIVTDDLDALIDAWPPEFSLDPTTLLPGRLADERWKGFVALDAGQIVAAIWCAPWQFDRQMPLAYAQPNSYEIVNLFVIPAARGKALSTRLLLYSMEMMRTRHGQDTALSRIFAERKGSVIAHERAGFESLGTLTLGCKLGRPYCRHRAETIPTPRKGDALPAAVILTGAVGNVLDHCRSLGSRGVETHVLDIYGSTTIYRASRYCTTATALPAEATMAQHAEHIIAWAREKQLPTRPVLLPTSDLMANVLAEHRDALSEFFIVGIGPSQPIRDMIDKARAHELAQAAGLDVPASAFVYTADELRTVAETMPFPVMMKPISWQARGETTIKAERIDTPAQLLADGERFLSQGASLTIQQYIPGGDPTIECYMFHRSLSGKVYAEATATKVYQSPPGRGIMAMGQATPLPAVVRQSRRLLEAIGYTGLGGIEYKHHEGKDYFIEVSVRPEGFQPLARVSGIDLPWIAYCDFIGHPIPNGLRQTKGYWIDEFCAVGVIFQANPFAVVWRLLTWLFRRRVRRSIWSWKDPLPAVVFWAKQVARQFRRRLGRKKTN